MTAEDMKQPFVSVDHPAATDRQTDSGMSSVATPETNARVRIKQIILCEEIKRLAGEQSVPVF